MLVAVDLRPRHSQTSLQLTEATSSTPTQFGFTIVELLIVIVVIGILAAITIVAYTGIQQQATATTLKSDLQQARTQLDIVRINNGAYPDSGDDLARSDGTNLKYTKTVDGYCLTASSAHTTKSFTTSSQTGSIEEGECEPYATTLAGSTPGFADGTGAVAQFNYPQGVAVDASGTVYVADTSNNIIRKITPGGEVTTLAGSGVSGNTNGTGTAARFYSPYGIAADASGTVYVADTSNNRIRKITPGGVVTTLAGSTGGYAEGTGTAAQFFSPTSVAVDTSGNVYVADTNNNRIRKITPGGEVTTLAGSGVMGYSDGTGTAAQFSHPYGVAVDTSGNVYVADRDNHRIRKITAAGKVTILAGSTPGFADGTGAVAQFTYPRGVAADASGTVYVADTSNNRIRKITPGGVVTTLAGSTGGYAEGTGTAAQFFSPRSVAVDSTGTIYVADTLNSRIRKIQ